MLRYIFFKVRITPQNSPFPGQPPTTGYQQMPPFKPTNQGLNLQPNLMAAAWAQAFSNGTTVTVPLFQEWRRCLIFIDSNSTFLQNHCSTRSRQLRACHFSSVYS